MELIRGLHNLREKHRGCVLSIGNFDGFHLGHQVLVARLKEHAARLRVPATVQIFEPTPREFFAPADELSGAPGRIATFRDKLCQLEGAGVDRVLCVRFDRRFAAIPAQEYVEQVLVRRLGVKAVVVGGDFRFGAGRGGDLALLQQAGARHGFSAEAVATVETEGERVSSTAVREALAVPDLERAARLLGRPYGLSGRVRQGLKLGRVLDMPTANIALKRKPALKLGVYVVQAEAKGQRWMGVSNIGVRPTLERSARLLEVHLFGNAGNLYGKTLDVRFLKFLRTEQRFESLEALKQQMQRDGEQARTWLKQFSSASS